MGVLYDEYTQTELEYVDVSFTMPYGTVVGRWYGSQRVRPLLAIHGWLDNLGTWNLLLPLLPKHLGVLCLDLPGHGYSCHLPTGQAYHSYEYLLVVRRVLDEYGWNKVSLLGHSMGAMICYLFAALFPDRVDMIVSIDVPHPPNETIHDLQNLQASVEQLLIENDRKAMIGMREPPSYTLEQLESLTYTGSQKSVEIINSRHIYERNVQRSKLFPEKYYFSRDARLKRYFAFRIDPKLNVELLKRVAKIPICIVLGNRSHVRRTRDEALVELQRRLNHHFELHIIDGTHHVHLNNAMDVAQAINGFISRFRPPLLETWSVGDDVVEAAVKKRNLRHALPKWQWRRNKL